MRFLKFNLLGIAKFIINNITYIALLEVGMGVYASYTIACLTVLVLSYWINKKYIFNSINSNHLSMMGNYIIIFFSYIIISYIIIYLMTNTIVPEVLFSSIVSIILVLPNYYATKYIFK
jgi:putative flippase GtrA